MPRPNPENPNRLVGFPPPGHHDTSASMLAHLAGTVEPQQRR
ncbi:hypothetical protein [Actinomadura sp. 6N118]